MRCKTCHYGSLEGVYDNRCSVCDREFDPEDPSTWELELIDFKGAGGARCIACHYPLANLIHPRCPECGQRFDPADSSTYEFEVVEQFKRRTRFPYDIHRQPVRILVCLVIAILGGFILNSIARGTPQDEGWQFNVAGFLGSLLFVPFLIVPVWWGYEAVMDIGRYFSSRLSGRRS